VDYRQTQLGGFGLFVLVMFLVILVAAVVVESGSSSLFDVVVLCLMAGALVVGVVFSRLSVVVTDDRLVASFLFGWPRRVIDFADVVGVRRARNLWWHGLGIRKIPGGWRYNVWGLDAVELQLVSGEVFSIGSAEPDALYDAVLSRTALGSAQSRYPRLIASPRSP